MEINSPLGGETPVKGKALLEIPERITAVASKPIETETAVFLGTATGHLKKVRESIFNLIPSIFCKIGCYRLPPDRRGAHKNFFNDPFLFKTEILLSNLFLNLIEEISSTPSIYFTNHNSISKFISNFRLQLEVRILLMSMTTLEWTKTRQWNKICSSINMETISTWRLLIRSQ